MGGLRRTFLEGDVGADTGQKGSQVKLGVPHTSQWGRFPYVKTNELWNPHSGQHHSHSQGAHGGALPCLNGTMFKWQEILEASGHDSCSLSLGNPTGY